MAATPSTMLPLGTLAPGFSLPDTVSGETIALDAIASGKKGTVVMFICNHCPYVLHVREELARLANDYIPRGIGFVAISSNDAVAYPQDSPEKMAGFARDNNFPFPYLHDESQDVARAYHAACTPDFYIFDDALRCVYRGQLDGSRPANDIPVTGADIRSALDALLDGRAISEKQVPSIGCNIKWKDKG